MMDQLVFVPAADMGDCTESEGDMPSGIFTADEDGDPDELVAVASDDSIAQLLAAAPDLFVACEMAYGLIDRVGDPITDKFLLGILRSALDKAAR